MKIRTLSILALAALAGTAACKKDGDANGGDSTATTADTSVVPGTDTVNQPTVVPTQDTVVKQTTTETTVDTTHGNANADSVKTDTAKKM